MTATHLPAPQPLVCHDYCSFPLTDVLPLEGKFSHNVCLKEPTKIRNRTKSTYFVNCSVLRCAFSAPLPLHTYNCTSSHHGGKEARINWSVRLYQNWKLPSIDPPWGLLASVRRFHTTNVLTIQKTNTYYHYCCKYVIPTVKSQMMDALGRQWLTYFLRIALGPWDYLKRQHPSKLPL